MDKGREVLLDPIKEIRLNRLHDTTALFRWYPYSSWPRGCALQQSIDLNITSDLIHLPGLDHEFESSHYIFIVAIIQEAY